MRSVGRRNWFFVLEKKIWGHESLCCSKRKVAGIKEVVGVIHHDPNALLFFGVAPRM